MSNSDRSAPDAADRGDDGLHRDVVDLRPPPEANPNANAGLAVPRTEHPRIRAPGKAGHFLLQFQGQVGSDPARASIGTSIEGSDTVQSPRRASLPGSRRVPAASAWAMRRSASWSWPRRLPISLNNTVSRCM